MAKPEVVSIQWWNRPVTWGVGLIVLAVLGLGMLGQSVSGPGDSNAADAVYAPADAPVPAPVSTPAPKLDPASVRSGDNGISIHGNNNTVTIPQATPRTTVNEVTIIQPEREKLVIVEQQVPVVVERRVEVPIIVERERRVPVYVSRSDDCGERRREYEYKVAEIKRRIFQMD